MKSIVRGDKENKCFICGRVGPTDYHHCLHGSRRKFADKYGLAVHLCHACHMELHDHGTMDRQLEALGQEAFEEIHGHEEYMIHSGKDYLSSVLKSHWIDHRGSWVCKTCGYESGYATPICPRCKSVMEDVRLTDEGLR